MMMPSIFGENLFDDFDSWFSDPVEKRFFGKKNPLYGKHAKNLMKTDVRETKNSYEVDVDLPGFKKDEIKLELDNGYLTISAAKGLDKDESNAPILFLSARTKDSDKTLGFSSGGDDYLAKPFSYNELISRAKALIRRYQVYKGKAEKVETPKNFSCKNLVVDEETKSVYSDGQLLELTDTEYAILLLLLKNRRQVFSTERLYEAVWKENFYYGAENTVMVHIRNLRRKVERDSKNPMIIKTSWGKGYYCD